MVLQVVRLACRGSRLSRAQGEETLGIIRPLFSPGTRFQVVPLETPGDRDKRTPLTDPSVPDDFFTRDIDQALLRGEANLAIHSAKDLPKSQAPGLCVAALLPGKDARDALVYRSGWDGRSAPKTIGTSSPRRTDEIEKLFPGAQKVPLRGTVDERLARLDKGELDAIIVAACALERLGLANRINQYLPYETAPLQGRLAITAKSDEEELLAVLKTTDFRLRLFEGTHAAAPAKQRAGPENPVTLFVGTNADHFPNFEPMILWPLIALVPRPLAERVKALQTMLNNVRGVLLTSPFAVRCFVDALIHWKDGRALNGKDLLAVGPATAREIEQMGFQPAAAPAGFGGLDALLKIVDAAYAGRYLYPCSAAAPADVRAAATRGRGIELMPCTFYENQMLSPGPLPTESFRRVLFTSPSTVKSYFSNYPDETRSDREWLAMGPSTLESLRQKGLKGMMIDEH